MWNYRIIKDSPESYGLYEVIYNDDGEISAHSEKPEIVGENPQDILEALQLMIADAKKHFNYFFPPEVNEEKILDINQIKFAPLCDESDLEDFVEYKFTEDTD
jgi:hypothetical protein|tara:strand:+ start:46995 stop:47303 length:309 start_codon:yes stop_codon:yes gene_type:complete